MCHRNTKDVGAATGGGKPLPPLYEEAKRMATCNRPMREWFLKNFQKEMKKMQRMGRKAERNKALLSSLVAEECLYNPKFRMYVQLKDAMVCL